MPMDERDLPIDQTAKGHPVTHSQPVGRGRSPGLSGGLHQLPDTGAPTTAAAMAGTGPVEEASTTPCL